nr:MFS transporter [Amycolatopsis taiwanensis]
MEAYWGWAVPASPTWCRCTSAARRSVTAVAVFAVGSVGGPLLGGLFTDHLGWRWVFYINVPTGLIALLLVVRFFTVTHHRVRASVDVLGSALLVGAITCVMLVTVWGGRDYAWDSGVVIGLLAASLALVLAFVIWERRAANPVLP